MPPDFFPNGLTLAAPKCPFGGTAVETVMTTEVVVVKGGGRGLGRHGTPNGMLPARSPPIKIAIYWKWVIL